MSYITTCQTPAPTTHMGWPQQGQWFLADGTTHQTTLWWFRPELPSPELPTQVKIIHYTCRKPNANLKL